MLRAEIRTILGLHRAAPRPPINRPRPGKRTAASTTQPLEASAPWRASTRPVLSPRVLVLAGTKWCHGQSRSCPPPPFPPGLCLSVRIRPPRPCRCLRLPSSVPDDILYCRLSALALYTLFHLHLAPMVFVPFCRPCSWYSSRQTSLVLRAHARASKAGPRSRSHAHQGLLASGCLSDKLHKVVRSASSFQRALGWLIYPHIHPVPDGLGLPSSLSIYPSPPSSPPCHPIGLLCRQRRRYTADLVPKPRLKSVQSLKSLSSEPRLLGNIAIPPELSP